MRRLQLIVLLLPIVPMVVACGASPSSEPVTGPPVTEGASQPSEAPEPSPPETSGSEQAPGGPAAGEFQLSDSGTAAEARGERPSQITATTTHAALRLFVVDGDNGPIPGIVIKLTGPTGLAYYTEETDAQGYAEVLVPAGQRYELEYLSLGRRNTTAAVDVADAPNRNIRLTLRYRRHREEPRTQGGPQRFLLDGIEFDTGRATIRPESHPRLDRVVEYMTHRRQARIQVAGHTDNVGNPRANQRLSQQRAQAVRAYLVSRGVDGARIEAVGYGDQQPLASNDTDAGRQQNRRIEAVEL